MAAPAKTEFSTKQWAVAATIAKTVKETLERGSVQTGRVLSAF